MVSVSNGERDEDGTDGSGVEKVRVQLKLCHQPY